MGELTGPFMFEVQAAFDYIKQWEGLRTEAYRDCVQKHEHGPGCRYSIGYGTISHMGEKISRDEARNRALEYIANDYNKFVEEFPSQPLNVKIAMLDLAYNAGYGVIRSFGGYLRGRDYLGLAEAYEHFIARYPWTSRRAAGARKIREVN